MNNKKIIGSSLFAEKEEKDIKEKLKELGCIVWIRPDGSFKDEMTGKSMVLTGSGNITWDDVNKRYEVESSSSSYAASISTGLQINTTFTNNNGYSFIATIQKNSTKVIGCLSLLVDLSWTPGRAITPGYNGTTNLKSWPTTAFDNALCGDTINRYYYPNNNKWNDVESYSGYYPSTWPNPLTIYIGCNLGTEYSNFYLYEYMLFNRKLTKSEVHQIKNDIPELY